MLLKFSSCHPIGLNSSVISTQRYGFNVLRQRFLGCETDKMQEYTVSFFNLFLLEYISLWQIFKNCLWLFPLFSDRCPITICALPSLGVFISLPCHKCPFVFPSSAPLIAFSLFPLFIHSQMTSFAYVKHWNLETVYERHHIMIVFQTLDNNTWFNNSKICLSFLNIISFSSIAR